MDSFHAKKQWYTLPTQCSFAPLFTSSPIKPPSPSFETVLPPQTRLFMERIRPTSLRTLNPKPKTPVRHTSHKPVPLSTSALCLDIGASSSAWRPEPKMSEWRPMRRDGRSVVTLGASASFTPRPHCPGSFCAPDLRTSGEWGVGVGSGSGRSGRSGRGPEDLSGQDDQDLES